MSRRDFITVLGGVVGLPLTARAQQPMPAIGYLGSGSGSLGTSDVFGLSHYVEAFRSGLREIGFIEGQNVALEYRWAESSDQLLEFARQLTALNVDVIFATSSTETGAARIATKPIPIVFATHADPVGTGHVASLARPGGNITGLSGLQSDLTAKALEILKEVNGTKPADLPVQQASRYQLIVNLKTADALGLTIPGSFLVRADEVIE